jgi:hypothetical protein
MGAKNLADEDDRSHAAKRPKGVELHKAQAAEANRVDLAAGTGRPHDLEAGCGVGPRTHRRTGDVTARGCHSSTIGFSVMRTEMVLLELLGKGVGGDFPVLTPAIGEIGGCKGHTGGAPAKRETR